ncbi:2-polyprenyl-6-methoxyphenol hydroxylase-like FAD-dependent oxidoreductase [Arthrobacter sp. UYEF21]
MMLGLLLARAGVQVTVLEKHSDFLRDFRGDTVHASTIRLLDELGLGDGFRQLPQSRLDTVALPIPGAGLITFGDFESLKPPYNYIAMMPQWDFLNFLATEAAREPTFTLRMEHAVTSLMFDGGRVAGVRYRTPAGSEGELRADLVVATDGRHSVLRRAAGLQPKDYPVPFDTWWFRLPRHASEKGAVAGIVPAFRDREAMIALFRDDYYQMGYLGPKGEDARIRAEGVERFRERVAGLRPDLADRVDSIRSIEDLHWLDVRLDRLRRWYVDGLLCLGDAAHAMSPVGGVGINLAIQDAVAAAARLARPLLRGQLSVTDLAAVERRRRMPTVVIQTVQRILHRAVFVPLFAGRRTGVPPALLFVLRHAPMVRRLMPRLIAFGPRPEHAPSFARRVPPRSPVEAAKTLRRARRHQPGNH